MHMLASTGERVLVIGADGALGSLTASAFERAGWEVLRGSRLPSRCRDWRRIDLDLPATVTPSLAEADVIVDTVPHPGVVAEQSIIDRGGLILNSAAPPTAWTQRLYTSRISPAGTVVLGAGIAPGLTNLVAAGLLAAHPDADEVELVFTLSAGATSGRAGHEFVHRNLTRRAEHETMAIPLPPPFGTRECLSFAESERGWIGDLAGARRVRCYVCFAEVEVHDALLARNRLGTISALDQAAFVRGASVSGSGVSSEPVAHWVCVRRDGVRLAAETLRCAGEYRGAAHATVALAQALQDARARAPLPTGVFGPEDLVALADLKPYLTNAGIRVSSEPV
ncbi:MAG: hypothetical protein JO181_17470 [Solirubrobacterales bacterium]|nr:hypothetical protein [Solirubrobacterales bacterium]